jgi:tripartite-type tricarboxylate transporter receptor subunit TctC
MAKVDMGSVPYRGGAPALNDLIGGHIRFGQQCAEARAASTRRCRRARSA